MKNKTSLRGAFDTLTDGFLKGNKINLKTNGESLLGEYKFNWFCFFQMTASDQTRVVIEDVQNNFSGTYLCEVTITPYYYALMQYANMTVIGMYIHMK